MGSLPSSLECFEQRIGYSFRERAWLEEALRHRSAAAAATPQVSNQRLEFLGDAVLQLVGSEELFRAAPEAREGVLSRRRSALTKGAFLAVLARELGLDSALVLSPAEEHSGGRNRPSALEDAFEALVCAVYLDGGLAAVRSAVLRWYGPLHGRLAPLEQPDNPKGRLQELVQPEHGNDALRYEISRVKGEPHQRRFDVHLYFFDRLIGTGTGGSIKEAEENAAREALAQWKTSAPD